MQQTQSIKPQTVSSEVRDGFPTFIREKQLRTHFIEIAHSTLWGWVANGTFPAPVKLSSGVTAWKRSDLKVWAEGNWTPPLGAD